MRSLEVLSGMTAMLMVMSVSYCPASFRSPTVRLMSFAKSSFVRRVLFMSASCPGMPIRYRYIPFISALSAELTSSNLLPLQ